MRKIFSLMLSIAIVFSLVACDVGYSTDTSNNKIQSTTNDVVVPSEDTTDQQESATNQPVSSGCSHSWKKATCTAPMTCSLCGAVSGSAAGHKWSAATCTKGQVCSVCGTNGSGALGHSDSGNGTCSRCGEDIILTELKSKFKTYLIIPSVGSSDNHYVQVKFSNASKYKAQLTGHVYANGKSCANKQIINQGVSLESGYEIVLRFDRDMFKTVKDMYLDNQSTAWTIIKINGVSYYLKFDSSGNAIWGKHPNDIGEY